MKKTYQPKISEVTRGWHYFDAKNKILGRLASEIAKYLMGKQKPTYSAHMDMGDNVVVVNASLVEVTGRKAKQKVYQKHSGYPGGFKEVKFEKLMNEDPTKVIEYAVKGMLPRNRLHSKRMRRMKVFPGADHPYSEKFEDKKKSD